MDLIGEKYGRLTVIKKAENGKYNRPRWLCKCDCGNNIVVNQSALKNGYTKSCGCLQKEIVGKLGRSHIGNIKGNKYDISGEYGKCYLSNGIEEYFVFDLDDYDKIKHYTWWKDGRGYVKAYIRKNDKESSVFVHNVIMNTSQGLVVDHINHNVLDNRKNNLRLVTISQNAMNSKLRDNNSSGITGVDYDTHNHHWRARIAVNGKRIMLGVFQDFEDAIKARKEAEEKYFGEYSYDNSIKKNI